MNIEIAYQIEQLKQKGLSDLDVAKKLKLDVKDVFYTRRALGIKSLPGGASKTIMVRVYDRSGNFVMAGTRKEVGKRLSYAPSTVAWWEKAENPPYRVERINRTHRIQEN